MRSHFIQPKELDALPISQVVFDHRSRHQLMPLLVCLQYIFVTPQLNEQVFALLEKAINSKTKSTTGRPGMSYWEILVLGVVRLNLNLDYDALQDQANNHKTLRGILGVSTKEIFKPGKRYPMQTLKDNVSLLTDELISDINLLLVKHGHQLKKKENETKNGSCSDVINLDLKTDTYAVESNIHFPTDISLVWDSIRCSTRTMIKLLIVLKINSTHLNGWRKVNNNLTKAKQAYLDAANVHRRKGKNYKSRLKVACTEFLRLAGNLKEKIEQSVIEIHALSIENVQVMALLFALDYYKQMLDKCIDLLKRRVLNGEKIPHKDKIFSIFEPHAEWITKGKSNNKVELGHNVLVTTDQYHFIVDHQVVIQQADAALIIPLCDRLEKNFGATSEYVLRKLSTDRGCESAANRAYAKKIFTLLVAMPKKGKKSEQQRAEESTEEFVSYRRKHSAIESNINELEQAGLDKVPDKGLPAFKRYVALGVLAYNMKRIGKMLLAQANNERQVKKKAA